MPEGKRATVDQLRSEREKLGRALALEQATEAATAAGIPPSFGALLAALPPEERVAKAEQIRAEFAERSGHPAAGLGPRDQEAGEFTAGPAGGDLLEVQVIEGEVEGADQDLPPERLEALAAVTRAGSEGGDPPTPPGAGKSSLSERIAGTESFSELEQIQQEMRSRRS